jgi:DNA-binding LytR/AlgR family response regulator
MDDKIRTLIVDDDTDAQEGVGRLVGRYAALQQAGTCDTALDVPNALRDGDIDLMLLRVEMPELSGLDLLESLEAPPAVVLITTSGEYAVDAFALDVTDYLLKPIGYPRFLEAMHRVEDRRSRQALRAASVGQAAAPPPDEAAAPDNALFLPADGALVRVRIPDISYVKANGDVMEVRTGDAQYATHTTMTDLQAQLPSSAFVRVHRSFLVQMDRVEKIKDDALVLGDTQIPIGPTYREALLNRIQTL